MCIHAFSKTSIAIFNDAIVDNREMDRFNDRDPSTLSIDVILAEYVEPPHVINPVIPITNTIRRLSRRGQLENV